MTRSSVSQSRMRAGEKRQENDSFVARYNRVAMVESVLSIRDKQQSMFRKAMVASLIVMGLFVIMAGLLGWL